MSDEEKGRLAQQDVTAWLNYRAPADSAKPWAPVETSLPDPDLLPLTPPLYTLVPALGAWLCERPIEALVHVAAWAATLVAAGAALLPLATTNFACRTLFACRVATGATALFALRILERRYSLYRHALSFQLHKAATLASVTIDRLNFRRCRCPVVLFLAVSAALLLHLLRHPPCGTDEATASWIAVQTYATCAAIPAVAASVCRYSRDPVEDAAIQRISHANVAHTQHRRGHS